MEYQGKKWFVKGEKIVEDEFGEKSLKPDFRMTKRYVEYLREKAKAEREQAYRIQLAKCKALFAKEGAVDDIEYGYLEMLRAQIS